MHPDRVVSHSFRFCPQSQNPVGDSSPTSACLAFYQMASVAQSYQMNTEKKANVGWAAEPSRGTLSGGGGKGGRAGDPTRTTTDGTKNKEPISRAIAPSGFRDNSGGGGGFLCFVPFSWVVGFLLGASAGRMMGR
jgi:hypothetical protein